MSESNNDRLSDIERRISLLEDAMLEGERGKRLGPNPESVEEKKQAAQIIERISERAKELAEVLPVDRTQRTLTDGRPVTSDHREIDPATGMQKAYIVLSAEERAKGFVRPVRQRYLHKTCGIVTHMGLALAETYARDPSFYDGTFCVGCKRHFPLDQFVWDGTDELLGS